MRQLARTLALAALIAAPAAAQQGSGPPPTVVTAEIAERDVSTRREYIARVEALEAVDLVARVPGFLVERRFEEGAFVEAGDPLLTIERAPYEVALSRAEAQLAEAEANRRDAERELERTRKLYDSDTVSESVLDDALAAAESVEAEIRAAEAAVAQAELDLSYTRIRAPIDGVIGKLAFTEGNFVDETSGPLARIVRDDPVHVVFSLSERDYLAAVRAAGSASPEALRAYFEPRLRLADGELYGREGRIAFASNAFDAATGTIPLRARFPNPDQILRPGQYATVMLRIGEPRRRPTVPYAAIGRDADGAFVYRLDGETVRRRAVTLGENTGRDVVVEDGLAPGDRVVVAGIQKVSDGQTVRTAPSRGSAGDGADTGAGRQAEAEAQR